MPNPGDVKNIKRDIALAIELYPGLQLIESHGKLPALKGKIEIIDKEIIIESFEVLLQYTRRFPFAYPLVYEIGGKFNITKDLHMNDDGSMCLNVEQQEVLHTRKGITTHSFIQQVLIPNLAWRMCRLEGIEAPLQEYGHGVQGIVDGYLDLLSVSTAEQVLTCLYMLLQNNLPERNDECFCKNGRKYKHCHEPKLDSIATIPKGIIFKHIEALCTLIKAN